MKWLMTFQLIAYCVHFLSFLSQKNLLKRGMDVLFKEVEDDSGIFIIIVLSSIQAVLIWPDGGPYSGLRCNESKRIQFDKRWKTQHYLTCTHSEKISHIGLSTILTKIVYHRVCPLYLDTVFTSEWRCKSRTTQVNNAYRDCVVLIFAILLD